MVAFSAEPAPAYGAGKLFSARGLTRRLSLVRGPLSTGAAVHGETASFCAVTARREGDAYVDVAAAPLRDD